MAPEPVAAQTGLSSYDWYWQVLPSGTIYPTYWASAKEPRLGMQAVYERNADTLIDSSLGGRIGLLKLGPLNSPQGWQVDVLAAAMLRQDPDENMDVISADYRIDLPLTYGYGPHRFKLAYYHTSAHVGDEYLLKNPGHVRLNYLRDALAFGYSVYPLPELRLYAEAAYSFTTDVAEPWEFQFGFDYGPAGPTGPFGAPFLAFNTHLREELDFGGNLALQAGWAWRSYTRPDGTLRTGLYFYDGASPQFSFYNQYERQIGWGLWYDF